MLLDTHLGRIHINELAHFLNVKPSVLVGVYRFKDLLGHLMEGLFVVEKHVERF